MEVCLCLHLFTSFQYIVRELYLYGYIRMKISSFVDYYIFWLFFPMDLLQHDMMLYLLVFHTILFVIYRMSYISLHPIQRALTKKLKQTNTSTQHIHVKELSYRLDKKFRSKGWNRNKWRHRSRDWDTFHGYCMIVHHMPSLSKREWKVNDIIN